MQEVIKKFIESINTHYPNIVIDEDNIKYQYVSPPHDSIRLPSGKCAVYVFAFTEDYKIPQLAGKVLKVGKAGPKSAPRFQSQHYLDNSTGSTVAKSLNSNPIFWDQIGLEYTVSGEQTICGEPGEWLKKSTNRHHFFIDQSVRDYTKIMGLLENFIRGTFGSILEGVATERN